MIDLDDMESRIVHRYIVRITDCARRHGKTMDREQAHTCKTIANREFAYALATYLRPRTPGWMGRAFAVSKIAEKQAFAAATSVIREVHRL